MRLILKILLITLSLLILVFFLGPKPSYEIVDNLPIKLDIPLDQIEAYIETMESKVDKIKPDNQARIIWADSTQKTEYAVVYIHGYSASQGEGDPVHRAIADSLGANLYLARLARHGIDDPDIFKDLAPKELVESAKEAVAIGKIIGQKVILMSTSTGSTLSVYLAANDPGVHALIMFSPNFDIADENSKMMLYPWGKQMLRLMMGSPYREWETNEKARQYWTTKNRIEGLIALRALLDQTMTKEVFTQIDQPLYIGYYYRDEFNQDEIISVEAIHDFIRTIKTPEDQLMLTTFPDARGHVFASKYMTDDTLIVLRDVDVFVDSIIRKRAENPEGY